MPDARDPTDASALLPLAFVSEPLVGGAERHLAGVARVTLGERTFGIRSPAFNEAASSASALICLLTDRIDAAVLDRMPMLRVVANMAVGVDNVDLAACRERSIVVTNTPDVLTEATADFAFALLLAAARRITEAGAFVRAGKFSIWRPDLLLGEPVSLQTLGIVGLGRIGQAVAKRANGFGMRILYTRCGAHSADDASGGPRHVDLDTLLRESDFVSVHCPLGPETRGLIGERELGLMRPHAILVNTARGGIVDEEALARALDRGALAGAGLDVFAGEASARPDRPIPIPERLLDHPRVVLAPHLGSADRRTREKMAELAVLGARSVLRGEEPAHRVV